MTKYALIGTFVLASVAQAQTFKVAKYSIGGDGGTDYLTAESGTGRVFVSRATHVMVVDPSKGSVVGDVPGTAGAPQDVLLRELITWSGG